jgi:crotonobetainyl-CoA:carnitine CoA-transferase CaiB-like acyl-CoA transferase
MLWDDAGMEKSVFFAGAAPHSVGPLAGVRVVDFSTSWSGPMACCVLADLGADVIKVEAPAGEITRRLPPDLPGTNLGYIFQAANRNKRSVTIDLHVDGARQLFLDLVATADVVVENFRAGALDGWGVGYAHCRAVKPDIVFVSITGWGQYGPLCDRAGYDPAAQAFSGWMALNGEPDGLPTKAATWICDDFAGLHGAIGALAALRHRDATGEGQHVDVSLLDTVLFQSNGLPTLAAMGHPIRRMGSEVEVAAPVNAFACADGHVYLAVVVDPHWAKLCEVMGQPDLARAPGFATARERTANRRTVNDVVAGWFAPLRADDAVRLVSGAGVTIARVNTMTEALADPHVAARGVLTDTKLEDGSIAPLVAPPVKFGRTPTTIRLGPPALGAHNDELLDELGYDAERRARLAADGAT